MAWRILRSAFAGLASVPATKNLMLRREPRFWLAKCQLSTSSTSKRISAVLEEKGVRITFQSQQTAVFPYFWLRDNCSKSREPSSHQKTYTSLTIPLHVKARNLRADDSWLHVEWDDGHESSFDVEFLQRFAPSEENLRKAHVAGSTIDWDGKTLSELPQIGYETVHSSEKGLFQVLQLLLKYGVCLLQGVPTVQGEVVKVAQKLTGQPHLQATIYGSTWDVQSKMDPENIAYTTYGLEPHQDLCYYEGTPGIQLLHCIRFDECVQGGENNFVDGFAVANRLRTEFPDDFEALCSVGQIMCPNHGH